MKVKRIKRRIYRNRKFCKKVFVMKFIEVGSTFYPLNDRVVFKKEIWPNGEHWVVLSYTDGSTGEIKIGEVANFKNLSFEAQIEKALSGKVKEVKF